MRYKVEVLAGRDGFREDGCAIASFRGGDGTGWVLWYEAGIVSARVGDEWAWATCVLKPQGGAVKLEWRVIDDRHEMWQDGVQESEVMSRLTLPDDGVLFVGEDPISGAIKIDGVQSVEVERG